KGSAYPGAISSPPHPLAPGVIERRKLHPRRVALPGNLDLPTSAVEPLPGHALCAMDIPERQRPADPVPPRARSGGADNLAVTVDRLLVVHERRRFAAVLEC